MGVLGLLGGLRSFVLFCVGDTVAVEVGVVILINLCVVGCVRACLQGSGVWGLLG